MKHPSTTLNQLRHLIATLALASTLAAQTATTPAVTTPVTTAPAVTTPALTTPPTTAKPAPPAPAIASLELPRLKSKGQPDLPRLAKTKVDVDELLNPSRIRSP